MSKVGIIANPASGKDIRRLVAYASLMSNRDKTDLVRRIILGIQSTGVDEIDSHIENAFDQARFGDPACAEADCADLDAARAQGAESHIRCTDRFDKRRCYPCCNSCTSTFHYERPSVYICAHASLL